MNIDKNTTDNELFAIVEIQGGLGKNFLATAFIRAIKKQHPDYKIIVCCSWDCPFFYNPDIYRFYTLGQMNSYFFSEYLKPTTKIFKQEVYNSEDHILQRKHITQSWCDMYNIPFDGQRIKMYLNPREIEIAKDKIKPDGRKILLIQTNGGSPQGQYSKKSWFRDIPISQAQEIVNRLKKDFRILHVRLPEQPALNGTEALNLPQRELCAVFTLSDRRLFMDSSCQHIAAALELPSTVCWIGNKPEVFGHPENKNILPNAKLINRLEKFSYTDIASIDGQIQQFPYDTVNLFDVDEIIDAINKQPVPDVSKMNFF